MQSERLYVDPDLSLAGFGPRLGLSTHQLSELVNSRLGKGFSRYLRERPDRRAKAIYVAEPKASVLSVGLSVGFTSQSNFYEAFREIEGSTPGQYRKLHTRQPPRRHSLMGRCSARSIPERSFGAMRGSIPIISEAKPARASTRLGTPSLPDGVPHESLLSSCWRPC